MSSLNHLRLIPVEGRSLSPAGMVVSHNHVCGLFTSLAERGAHYRNVQATCTETHLILWSLDKDVMLPWIEKPEIYLTQLDKSVFFPINLRPELPDKWMSGIIDTLSSTRGLAKPLLLLPTGEKVVIVELGKNSSPVSVIDWKRLAGGM